MNLINLMNTKVQQKVSLVLWAASLALVMQVQPLHAMNEERDVSEDENLSMSEGSQAKIDDIFSNMDNIIASFEGSKNSLESSATQSVNWLNELAGLNVERSEVTDFSPSHYNIHNEANLAENNVAQKAMALKQGMENFTSALRAVMPKFLRNKDRLERNKERAERREQEMLNKAIALSMISEPNEDQ